GGGGVRESRRAVPSTLDAGWPGETAGEKSPRSETRLVRRSRPRLRVGLRDGQTVGQSGLRRQVEFHRRSAPRRAGGRDVTPTNDASAISGIAFAADGSVSDVGRLRALVGGTATILIVVGLLQIARILVAPSDGVNLTMPSNMAVSRDASPLAVEATASAAELASPGSAALPPAGRPSAIFYAADGAAVATSETGILVPVWTPEQEPEATGQI